MSRFGGNTMHRNMDRALGSVAVVGALGLAAVVAMAFAQPSFALQAWLGAAFAWSGVPIGALGLLLLHALVGGPWGRAVGPVLSASARMLPLIAVAFLPIILAPSLVYPWAAEGATGNPAIAAKSGYLNPTFFALRTIVYFAIWIALMLLIATGDGRSGGRSGARLRPGIAMVIFVIAASFAAVDWAMSVDPRYASSAFGLLVTVTNLLAALAFAIPMVALTAPPEILAEAEDHRVRNALAGLLASGVLLWAYLSFMQYLVVWSGDIPQESAWYLDRIAGAWNLVPWMLGILLGVVPVVTLALPAGRRTVRRIAAVSALISIMRLIEALWLVLPSFPYRSWLQPLAWVAATVGLGGLYVAGVLWLSAREPRTAVAAEAARHG
jgi:hypothetical protein